MKPKLIGTFFMNKTCVRNMLTNDDIVYCRAYGIEKFVCGIFDDGSWKPLFGYSSSSDIDMRSVGRWLVGHTYEEVEVLLDALYWDTYSCVSHLLII